MIQRRPRAGPTGLVFATVLLASLIGFGVFSDRANESATAAAMATLDRDLAREGWSAEVRQIAAWAIGSGDHAGLPFIVVDQARGRLFAFSGKGRLVGSTPILQGDGSTDDGAPPGRFVADTRHAGSDAAIVWANEHDTLLLQAAPPPAAWKQQPVATRYHRHAGGSLHVAGEFYRQHLRAFRHRASVAYVLPGALGMQRSTRVYTLAPDLHRPGRSA